MRRPHNSHTSIPNPTVGAIIPRVNLIRRSAPNDRVREWVQARIINDAGMLEHYVADGSNPAHTTVNFNGWTRRNPNGYATDRRLHSRFESAYVQNHIAIGDKTFTAERLAAGAQMLRNLWWTAWITSAPPTR